MFEMIVILILSQPLLAGSTVLNGTTMSIYVTEMTMTIKHGPFATEEACKAYLGTIPDKVMQNNMNLDVKSKVCSPAPAQPKIAS